MFDILDCTLRDGSYINNFQFTAHETSILTKAIQETGIRFIEIGHGLGLGASRLGGAFEAAATDEQYLTAAAEVIEESKFGMFCIPGIAKLEDIDLAHSIGMHFIRIGTNITEVEESKPFIEHAKKHDMFVCSNFMKSYAVSPDVFVEKASLSKEYGSDLVYIVDSAGGMMPDELLAYIKSLKENVEIEFGYHGHNNLGLAVASSLICESEGARFVDCSLQGLGRGGGNAPTEQFAILLMRKYPDLKLDIFKILDIGFDFIQCLIPQPGLNPIDLVSGYALFHSSYMPVIKKYSYKYCVDPRELIIELCKKDSINAPPELVDEIASKLSPIKKNMFLSKYHLERYYVNEQQ